MRDYETSLVQIEWSVVAREVRYVYVENDHT